MPPTPLLLFAIAVIFVAAIVRGFSGFGFSLISITALSFVFKPVEVIGAVFLMEIAASLNLLPGIWRKINWKALAWLTAGAVLATPAGVYLLARVPEAPMRLALGLFVLVTVVALLSGFALKRAPGRAATFGAGAASGLLNGAFGIGGPPAILFFFSSPAGAAAGRATLIAYFIATDAIGIVNQLSQGLLAIDHVWKALLFLPPLLIGVAIGARAFKSVDEALFRQIVLVLLGLMALVMIGISVRDLKLW